MAEIDFLSTVHQSTRRNYLERVTDIDKAVASEIAARFGQEYWDGERQFGYGGYKYDGRWQPVAQAIAEHYKLGPGSKILDVGCGKAFLLYEFTKVLENVEVHGVDISEYALENAKEEMRPHLKNCHARALPYESDYFDLVISINTLHNLFVQDLWPAMAEIERVGKTSAKYVSVEAYRTEQEKVNLMYWQLTCRAFHTPTEWTWIFEKTGYTGDHGFIFFT